MTKDGPRFVASLQKPDDPCCYKDFFETEVLKEAKEAAEKAVKKHNRAVLIFDRQTHFVNCKIEPEKTEEEAPKPVVNVRKSRKKPEKKPEVKKSRSSKYFD